MAHGIKNTRNGPAGRSEAGVVPAATACLLAALTLAAAVSCAPPRGRPPAPYYGAAPSNVRGVDVSCLKGRRIAIDPGHGGVFRGALGRAGLAEADVNLGVALYLWGLLRDAGAEAMLTRSSDTDFVDGASGELRQDLTRRSEAAAAFRPDLFVSLHHNADLSRSEDKNQVETYFRMLDDGPSKDVAALVHLRLQERLQIPEGAVLAGNYFVLRNSNCAALLGEPSYITNPWVEDRLRLAEKQLLEAQAYFLGIVDYFSKGTPAIAGMSPRDTVVTDSRPWFGAAPAGGGGVVDPSSVVCELDGAPIGASYDQAAGRLVARPPGPLPGGRHEFCFSFRNEAGNSSPRTCASFETDPPPARLSLKAEPAGLAGEGCVLVTAAVSDENANPVRDGTPVLFSSSAGSFARETVLTAAGIASSFFLGGGTESVSLRARSRALTDSISLAPPGEAVLCLTVSDFGTGGPVAGAEVVEGDSVRAVTTPQGLAVVAGRADGLIVRSTGYVPALVNAESLRETEGGDRFPQRVPGAMRTVRMKPVALGVLQGVRVAVDLGGTAVLSEKAARELTALLRGAGAQVIFFQPGMPDADKVAASERFGSKRYVRMEPAPDGRWAFLHYPDSKSGEKLAAELASWWSRVAADGKAAVTEDAHYVLRQTSCPAVVARLGRVDGSREEAAALRTAYALYLAILEDVGLDASLLVESSVRAGGAFEGAAAYMVLDGFVRVPLSADGNARFFCEAGLHMVTVESKSGKTTPHFVTVAPAQQFDKAVK